MIPYDRRCSPHVVLFLIVCIRCSPVAVNQHPHGGAEIMDLDEDERQRRVMLPQMGVGFDTDINHTQQPPSAAVPQPIMKPMCRPSLPTSAEGKQIKSSDTVKK